MIIIIDLSMNRSWSYVATHDGYYEANAKIDEIVGMGHAVGGHVARVRAYCR